MKELREAAEALLRAVCGSPGNCQAIGSEERMRHDRLATALKDTEAGEEWERYAEAVDATFTWLHRSGITTLALAGLVEAVYAADPRKDKAKAPETCGEPIGPSGGDCTLPRGHDEDGSPPAPKDEARCGSINAAMTATCGRAMDHEGEHRAGNWCGWPNVAPKESEPPTCFEAAMLRQQVISALRGAADLLATDRKEK